MEVIKNKNVMLVGDLTSAGSRGVELLIEADAEERSKIIK